MFAKLARVGFSLAALTFTVVTLTTTVEAQTASQPPVTTTPTKAKTTTVAKKPAKTAKADVKKENLFHFLPFQKIAELHPRQRLRYVIALRNLVVTAEKTQLSFGMTRSAELEKIKNNDLYAAFFSPKAYAADDPPKGPSAKSGGGLYTTDSCIYGFWVEPYPTAGSIQKFKCVNTHPCPGDVGVLCNPTITGMMNLNDDCVLAKDEYRATQICATRMSDLSDANRVTSHQAVQDAKDFLKFTPCDSFKGDNVQYNKCVRDRAASKDASDMVHNLVMHMYDNEAYSTLFGVVGYYQKNDMDQPDPDHKGKLLANVKAGADGSGEEQVFENIYNGFNFRKFGKDTEAVQEGIENFFGGILNHCDQLTADALNTRVGQYKSENDTNRPELVQRDILRRDLLNSDITNHNLSSVRSMYENPECILVDHRVQAAIAQILPTVNSGVIINTDLPKPAENPVAPTIIEPLTKSAGCSREVYRDDSEIYQHGTRCMICPIENAAHQYAQRLGDAVKTASGSELTKLQKAIDKYSNYSPSNKWEALLTTMATACGDTVTSGSSVPAGMMAKYNEAFGHCADNIGYEWSTATRPGSPDVEGSPQEYKRFVETASNWDDGKECGDKEHKEQNAMVDKNFTKFFGMSYIDATALFCQKGRVHRFWPFSRKCKSDINSLSLSDQDFKSQARDRVNESTIDKYKMSPSLKACMKEALDTRKNLYPDNKICLNVQNIGRESEFATLPQASLDAGGTAIIANDSSCMNSNMKSEFKGNQCVGWTKPQEIRKAYSSQTLYAGFGTDFPDYITCSTPDTMNCTITDWNKTGKCQVHPHRTGSRSDQLITESPACYSANSPQVSHMTSYSGGTSK